MAAAGESATVADLAAQISPKGNIESILKILVACISLAYGTGFVVVMTFLDRYGIHETGGDLFKLRYIYVGALCLACPAAMVCILLGLFSGNHFLPIDDRASSLRQVIGRLFAPRQNAPLPFLLINLNIIFVFYCVIAFAHPGLFATKQMLFNGLYLPMAATLGIRLIFGQQSLWSSGLNLVRWLLVFISLLMSVLILKDIDFMSMLGERTYNYLFLQVFFVFFVYRFTKWPILALDPKERLARLLVRFMIAASIFVIGVLSFAHTVFNHIPAEKGGGDFSQMTDSRICFDDAHRASIPVALFDDMNRQPLCSVPVKVLEETPADVYIARSSDRGSFSARDAPNSAVLWRSGKYYPIVFQISRTVISSVVILNNRDLVQISKPNSPHTVAEPASFGSPLGQ